MMLTPAFKNRFKGIIEEHADLKNYSFMHTGGYARILLKPFDINDLKLIYDNFGGAVCIGNGSNVLFKENLDHLVVVDKNFKGDISVRDNEIIVGAGKNLSEVIKSAYNNSLSGLEELVGIPGTVGGAVKMNAGAFGKTIFDIMRSFTVFNMLDGEIKEVRFEKFRRRYRDGGLNTGDIVVSAVLRLKCSEKDKIFIGLTNFSKNRRSKQPQNGYSLGSIFKNPRQYPAGWLIEECGLKGKKIGGAFVSEKHANFIVNDGTATSEDILKLMELIVNKVSNRFNIKLKPEIVII